MLICILDLNVDGGVTGPWRSTTVHGQDAHTQCTSRLTVEPPRSGHLTGSRIHTHYVTSGSGFIVVVVGNAVHHVGVVALHNNYQWDCDKVLFGGAPPFPTSLPCPFFSPFPILFPPFALVLSPNSQKPGVLPYEKLTFYCCIKVSFSACCSGMLKTVWKCVWFKVILGSLSGASLPSKVFAGTGSLLCTHPAPLHAW